MSSEENKAIVRRMLQAIASNDDAAINELFSPNWVNHDPSLPPLQGIEGAKQLTALFLGGFPDMHLVEEDMIADGDKVAARFRLIGTNTGPMMGMPPTGKSVDITATGIFRIVDGKATDNWVNLDAMGMMQQLGVIPARG